MTDAPPPPAGDEPFEPWLDVFPPDKPPNELLIGLCAGRDLAIRDTSVFTKGGSSDPRCVFSIKDRPDLKCQSTVKKKNLNPVYGETFSFELEVRDRQVAGGDGAQPLHTPPILQIINRPAVAQVVKSCRITAPASRREGDEPA